MWHHRARVCDWRGRGPKQKRQKNVKNYKIWVSSSTNGPSLCTNMFYFFTSFVDTKWKSFWIKSFGNLDLPKVFLCLFKLNETGFYIKTLPRNSNNFYLYFWLDEWWNELDLLMWLILLSKNDKKLWFCDLGKCIFDV